MAPGTHQRGCLGPNVEKFQIHFTHTYSFKKPNKKNYNRAKELQYTVMLLYLFYDSLLATCPKKKWKLKNGPRRKDSLLYVKYILNIFLLIFQHLFISIWVVSNASLSVHLVASSRRPAGGTSLLSSTSIKKRQLSHIRTSLYIPSTWQEK